MVYYQVERRGRKEGRENGGKKCRDVMDTIEQGSWTEQDRIGQGRTGMLQL
jgi:hypothetical protein